MRVARVPRVVVAMVLMSVVASSSIHAQQLSATYGRSRSDNQRVQTLDGYSIQLTSGAKGRFAGGFGFRQYSGRHEFLGGCSWFDTACVPRPIREATRQREYEGLLAFTLLRGAPRGVAFETRMLAGVQLVNARVQSTEWVRGGPEEKAAAIGSSIGFDANVNPSKRVPIGVRLGWTWSRYSDDKDVLDYVLPFKDVDAARVEVGLTWFFPPAPAR